MQTNRRSRDRQFPDWHSSPGFRPPTLGERRGGAALVIILAFIVLLTGLILAFFSKSILDRQISNSSASKAKVSAFADGAANAITGELEQEIVLTSSATPVASGTIYTPLAPAGMLPQISGTNGIASLAPNLLKISGTGQLFYSGSNGTIPSSGVPNVIAVSSTVPSLNGRYVTPARWNEHYLLPLLSSTDATPQPSSFTPPAWVLVARDGSNPTPATVTSAMTVSGTNPVVGRYAFAIYHEGGLLDINAAGYPTTSSTTQLAYKPALAYADLTQIGLTSSQINQLVAWRNATSIQPSGTFSNPTLPSTSGSAYSTFVLSNTTGYLTVGGTADQIFTSRQQLIKFAQTGLGLSGTNLNVLNYLTHFTRALEQPSFVPNPSRPKIINPASTPPPYTAPNNYMGNNDAAGGDNLINLPFLSVRVTGTFTRMDGTTAQIGEPLVKKRFPLIRLSWMTYAGPSATAPQAVQTALLNVGVSQAEINAGTAQNIYNDFGLTWTGTGSWTYNHGIKNSSGQLIIGKLTDAAAANREPDFLELLKAAIDVGSLAKAGPNLPGGGGGDYEYQYVLDSAVDYNILQIAANLIDQVTPDSIPTILQIQASSSSPVRSLRGIEDIPYFYRFHPFSVMGQAPIPVLTSGSTITLTTGEPVSSAFGNGTVTTGSGSGTLTFSDAAPVAEAGSLTQTGSAYLFYVPEVWNPHDANDDPNIQTPNTTIRPTAYRVTLDSADPGGITNFQDSAQVLPKTSSTGTGGSAISGSPDPTKPISPMAVLNSSTNANDTMVFSDNNGQLFREPTLLWRSGYPTGSGLGSMGGGVTATDPNTSLTYIGMPLGQCPVSVLVTVTGTVTASGGYTSSGGANSYIVQEHTINEGTTAFPFGDIPSHMYTFRLQYQNRSAGSVTGTNWITYDEKYADNHNLGTPNLIVSRADYPNSLYENPLQDNNGVAAGNGQLADTSGVIDPLTPRFGVGLGYVGLGQTSTTGGQNSYVKLATGYVPEPSVSGSGVWSWSANSASGAAFNTAVAASNFCIMESDRPRTDIGIYTSLSQPGMSGDPGYNTQMRWFSGVGYYVPDSSGGVQNGFVGPNEFNGLLSQNNPAITFQSFYGGESAQFYYEDPDGVARRAMGAYAETSLSTSASTVGLPEVTADSFPSGASGSEGVPTPLSTGQSESRPIVLNRPFRSVAEMSYASRGSPWRHIDFFTPESGDTALLDVFCVNELPASNMVAGKVNLNTSQPLVLRSILAGAYEDELKFYANPPSVGGLGLSATMSAVDASNVAQAQVARTTDTVNNWHGPMANIGELVGRYVSTVANSGSATTGSDTYVYLQPTFPPSPVYPPVTSGLAITYSGLSAALSTSGTNGSLSSTLFVSNSNAALIQRGREAAIRPLVDCGQTRVWNVMIDLIAQTGKYPQSTTNPAQFEVEGEKHYWVHLAIDRYTGTVVDKQVEVLPE